MNLIAVKLRLKCFRLYSAFRRGHGTYDEGFFWVSVQVLGKYRRLLSFLPAVSFSPMIHCLASRVRDARALDEYRGVQSEYSSSRRDASGFPRGPDAVPGPVSRLFQHMGNAVLPHMKLAALHEIQNILVCVPLEMNPGVLVGDKSHQFDSWHIVSVHR